MIREPQLLYRERMATAFRRARTFLFVLSNPQRRQSLTRERRKIIAQIQELGQRRKEQENDPTVPSE